MTVHCSSQFRLAAKCFLSRTHTLAHYNEHTGALTCHATLRGQKDRQYFGDDPLLAEEPLDAKRQVIGTIKI